MIISIHINNIQLRHSKKNWLIQFLTKNTFGFLGITNSIKLLLPNYNLFFYINKVGSAKNKIIFNLFF